MLQQHFILCGLGRVGWRVLDYLRASGAAVVAIDNRCSADDPRLGGVTLIEGDCRKPEVLRRAGVERARGVLIVTSEDIVSLSTALVVHHLNPDVRVVVRLFNQGLTARLGKAMKNVCALSTSALAAPLLALIARTGEALGAFRPEDGVRRQVAEVHVRAASPLCGQRIGEAAGHAECTLVAHVPLRQSPRFLHRIDVDAPLASGDRVVLCGEPARLTVLRHGHEPESGPESKWVGYLRRPARALWHTLREVDTPVKITANVLVTVIALSTLVFRLGMQHDTIPDALYRTISLMATGADMGGQELEPGAWQKVFVSLLRIVGAALTAAFTAILTNYLVRMHLKGALEVRRIPESRHVVVCGLGNVGFRVVQELLREGERVVVIERSRDNAFITSARRLGAAVIVGDATLAEVLRQANAPSARAVLAVTSNELVNVEVVLLVRELNAAQRVLARLTDSNLAHTLREAADVRLAVSIPELAAPAFAAALFGDRVHSVFLVEGRLLAVVDLYVQPLDDLLEGQPVRALAVDYQLQPVCLVGPDGTTRRQPMNLRLHAGDRLTVIVGLTDLQRLLGREKVPAEHSVEVTTCPLPARPFVVQLLRTYQGLGSEAAEQAAQQLPLSLASGLTRGQAEDLLYLLTRERVTGQIRSPAHA